MRFVQRNKKTQRLVDTLRTSLLLIGIPGIFEPKLHILISGFPSVSASVQVYGRFRETYRRQFSFTALITHVRGCFP